MTMRRNGMKFDKSKVCVAGLHDVPVGTKGYCARTVYDLDRYVTTEEKQAIGVLYDACGGYYFVSGKDYNFDCTMFYTLPEKQYRPYETIEELYALLGKIIVTKDGSKRCIVTSVENCNNTIFINNMGTTCTFDNYTMEDGTPVGVEV